jgi:hypothetical protein
MINMPIEKEVEMFADIEKHMLDIFRRKRADYGPTTAETFEKFGAVSMLVRLHDKLGRLDNIALHVGRPSVVEESARDTLIDLANYAIIMLIELEKIKMQETRAEEELKRSANY